MEILGEDITAQLLNFPKMLYITGATILCLGLFTPINDILTIPIAGLLTYRWISIHSCFLKQVKNRLKI